MQQFALEEVSVFEDISSEFVMGGENLGRKSAIANTQIYRTSEKDSICLSYKTMFSTEYRKLRFVTSKIMYLIPRGKKMFKPIIR